MKEFTTYRNAGVIGRLCMLLLLTMSGCQKLVNIPEPIDSITTSEAFSTDQNAIIAIYGAYADLSYWKGNTNFLNGALSTYSAMSADEISPFEVSNSPFQNNNILADDGGVLNFYWKPMYTLIYESNAIIEGADASKTLSQQAKQQVTGEAKFLRAVGNFYLVNTFGDVPLVTTTEWAKTNLLSRSPVNDLYQQIIQDLQDAQNQLSLDYAFAGGERIRANRYVATAFLARVFLYTKAWDKAIVESSKVIDNNNYALIDDLNQVFLKNNNEAIWQLQVVDRYPYAVNDAASFVPRVPPYTSPAYQMTETFLASFEPDDLRKVNWLDSAVSDGQYYTAGTYYYPTKYKNREGSSFVDVTEYYTVLRLAEQYLIRAEARAQINDLIGAISDLNVIRKRAGLADLSPDLSKEMVLAAIAQENRIEFFTEEGHRWFDLKRTGKANEVLGLIKSGKWQGTDQLYPIPLSEIRLNPNLSQNAGY